MNLRKIAHILENKILQFPAISKCIVTSVKLYEEIKFRKKLHDMDFWWYKTGGACFVLFPPSFYYTHTPEEIERITKETREKIRKLINELD